VATSLADYYGAIQQGYVTSSTSSIGGLLGGFAQQQYNLGRVIYANNLGVANFYSSQSIPTPRGVEPETRKTVLEALRSEIKSWCGEVLTF